MFNNAGVGLVGEVRDLDLEHWQQLLSVNLWGAIYGTISAYQVMVQQGTGHIINVSSIAGLVPTPLGTPYATSKHALVGLSTSLRAEAAGLGVRVSVVCPAFVRTGIYDRNRYVGLRREGFRRTEPSLFYRLEPAFCGGCIGFSRE
jgi:short-subunit dehydrogenase